MILHVSIRYERQECHEFFQTMEECVAFLQSRQWNPPDRGEGYFQSLLIQPTDNLPMSYIKEGDWFCGKIKGRAGRFQRRTEGIWNRDTNELVIPACEILGQNVVEI